MGPKGLIGPKQVLFLAPVLDIRRFFYYSN